MGVRRVVTGHTPDGKAIIASDTEVDATPVGALGSATTLRVGSRRHGRLPRRRFPTAVRDRCSRRPADAGIAVLKLAPGGEDFDEFVRTALVPWADPDAPGMHRTATLDYDVVLEGTVGLELDDGVVVTLHPGDIVVQNGTRHRWLNQGDTVARMLAVTIGATNALPSGPPA